MSIRISKDFRVTLLIILTFFMLGLLFFYVPKYFSYNRLTEIAQTLPNYQGRNLSSGMRSSADCYSVGDSSSCWALVTQIKAEHDTKSETEKFIQSLQESGIRWSEYKVGDTSVDSDVFIRNGRNYQVYISHGTDSTIITLLEY